MKYIRTKDGIYENNGLMQSNSTIEENSIIVCGGHFAIPVSNIIKQADTIEELCDEFIAVVNDNPQQHQFMKPFDYYMRSLNPKDVSLYGAIWTDKGLIFVAKMNDKGELELL